MVEIRELVRRAVNRLIEEDGDLLRNDTGEQAITHQIAVYLKPLFPEWHVYCEFNRDMETVKRLKYALSPGEDILEKQVVPDIIIHHRKTPGNLLVIELKKTTNPEPVWAHRGK